MCGCGTILYEHVAYSDTFIQNMSVEGEDTHGFEWNFRPG